MSKAVIFFAQGLEECEGLLCVDILRRAGVEVTVAAVGGERVVRSARQVNVVADALAEELDYSGFDAVILPGGLPGVDHLKADATVRRTCCDFAAAGKLVAAICAAPTLLSKLGITEGKRCVCYPGLEHEMGSAKMEDAATVQDGRLLTGRGPGAAIDFGLMLLKVLRGEQAAQQVQTGMVYHNA